MRSTINLASPLKKESHEVHRLLIVSVVAFAGVFIFAASLLGYFLYVRNQVSNTVDEENQVIAQINANPQQKVNALVLKERLNDITMILEGRGDINKEIEAVLSLIPDELSVSSFAIQGNDVVVGLKSADLSGFNKFLEEDILKIEGQTNFPIVKSDIVDFQVQDAAIPRYFMEVSFTIAQ